MAMRANPGKFDNALDEAVWSLSLDGGADQEVGSSSEPPGTWAGLLRDGAELAADIRADRSDFPNVTDADLEHLLNEGAAGVILMENSDGQVTVKYYASATDLDNDWAEVEEELELDDEEDDGDDGPGTAIVPVGSTALATTDPVLEPGYAHALESPESTGAYKTARDDDWDTVVIGDDEVQASEFVGHHKIDDALVCVFWNDEAYCFYAQVPRRLAKNARQRLRRNGPIDDGDVLLEVQMYDRGRWVPAHGRGSTGFTDVAEAQGVARNLRERGIKTRVIPISYASNAGVEEDEELEENSSERPELERSGVLDQLLEMQAETLEPSGSGRVPREVKNELTVTPELRRVTREYEAALLYTLAEVVMRHPPNDGATSEELFDDNAPYLVLMTLRGEGVGIWDGSWDAHYDSSQIKNVERTLKNKLRIYADDTGSGKLTNALDEAVYAAASEAGYELTDEGYVEVELEENRRPKGGSRARARGMTRNHRAHARYDVFLNGELLEPVYMDPGLTNAEVRDKLIATGYDPRITVDRPPARRTNLPPHYKMTANRKWSRAYMDTLPDSAFLYVAPGGRKDLENKTIPRRLRHFPYKDTRGAIDLPHLRNALSRIPQSKLPRPVKDAAQAKAQEILASHGGYQ